jgi:hypothetical protein
MKKCIHLCRNPKEAQMVEDQPCLFIDKAYENWEWLSGAEAHYHRLGHFYGLKTFLEKSECVFSRRMQKQVWKTGRAPEVVGRVFKVRTRTYRPYRNWKWEDRWGYITEHVKVFDPYVPDSPFIKASEDVQSKYWEQTAALEEYMERYYVNFYDSHDGNFGVNSHGDVVLIDFGEVSLGVD